jgi:hypothetical protein
MRIGVVLFDSANSLSGGDQTFLSLDQGWASVSGEQALRISSHAELAQDVLWITNLNEEQFFRAKLQNSTIYRAEGFLRSSLRNIYSELGVDPRFVAHDDVVQALSTIAQRVVTYCEDNLHVNIRSKAFVDDVALAIGAPKPQVADEFKDIVESCAQFTYTRPVKANNYINNGQFLTLRRNRVVHARHLLSLPVPPDTGWEYISRQKLPVERSDIESMLEQLDRPFMVRCSLTNVNPMVAEVFTVVSGAQVVREWITDEEWRIARLWADIDYRALLLCNDAPVEIAQRAALPASPLAPMSYTMGLVSELIWNAMSTKRGFKDAASYTAAAAWLRARDRMVMFDYAERLHAKGLRIWGYGGGNVVVVYPDGGLRHTLDVSTDMGLVPPASKLLEAKRAGELVNA